MKTTLVTVKQCGNPAEAAFFASYLEKARALLANPPKPLEENMEFTDNSIATGFVPGEPLTRCPLCGSENIIALSGNNALVWSLRLLSFGLYEPAADPMWVCRDCDWDSRRRMGK